MVIIQTYGIIFLMDSGISNRIIQLIEALGHTKNSFSQAIGLTNNVTIGRIVNENRKPSYEILEKIIQTFGSIDANWLFSGEGKMFKDDAHSNAHFYAHLKPNVHSKVYKKEEDTSQKQNYTKYSMLFSKKPELLNEQDESYNGLGFSVPAVLERLKKCTSTATDSELSELLGVKSGTVSAWRNRNTINYELIINICRLNKWDLNYIFLGQQLRTTAINAQPAPNKSQLNEYLTTIESQKLTIANLQGKIELLKEMLSKPNSK